MTRNQACKTVSWRNHTEKSTTLWPRSISFWPPNQHSIFLFQYFNVQLLGKYFQTSVWQLCDCCQILDLINFQNKLTWLISNTAGISRESRLKYSKLTHSYAKNSPFTWFLNWKLHIDTDSIHFICQFSNAFSWMKFFKFRLRCHWSLFPRVQLTIFQHWFRSWLGAVQATSHYLIQWWLVYRRIYASLGLNAFRTNDTCH